MSPDTSESLPLTPTSAVSPRKGIPKDVYRRFQVLNFVGTSVLAVATGVFTQYGADAAQEVLEAWLRSQYRMEIGEYKYLADAIKGLLVTGSTVALGELFSYIVRYCKRRNTSSLEANLTEHDRIRLKIGIPSLAVLAAGLGVASGAGARALGSLNTLLAASLKGGLTGIISTGFWKAVRYCGGPDTNLSFEGYSEHGSAVPEGHSNPSRYSPSPVNTVEESRPKHQSQPTARRLEYS